MKLRLIQSIAIKDQQKTFDLEEFFNQVSVSSSRMIQIKKKIIQLIKELVENKSIEPELQIIYKNGNEKQVQIEKLTTSRINKRIKYLKFNEIINTNIKK